jgi:hypothetical protein
MNVESLKVAFGDCKYDSCVCNTRSSYLNISSPEIFIYDENPIQIAKSDQPFQLKVLNPDGHEICIIKTDHCLFTDQTKKCDCVIFDNSICYFVEIKTGKNRKELRKRLLSNLPPQYWFLKITILIYRIMLPKL